MTMIRKNYVNFWNYSVALLTFASVLTYSQAHIFEFTLEPSDTVVESGHSAVLDCVVKTSHHHPSSVFIQWLDQDRQVLSFSGDSYRSQLTNGSLYINSVTEEQRLTGTYQCKASLPNIGSIVSRTAKLSIASLSGFHEEPRDMSVYVGQKVYFACRIHGLPPPRIRWLKDERPLQIDDLRMIILPSGALEIDEVIEADQGSYRCNATSLNIYTLSNKAVLTVNDDVDASKQLSPPKFIVQPRPEIVVEQQQVSLDCAAIGYPKPKITWLKDGSILDMNDLDSRFSLVGTTSSLRITNIQESDAGTYQCRAENREDTLEASADIQVQVPPRFIIKPKDVLEYEFKDTQLECKVHGIPTPKIQWLKNGELITPSEYYQIVNGNNLKIIGLITNDSGLIQCIASNAAGNIQTSASIKVLKEAQTKKESKKHKHGNVKKNRYKDTQKQLNKTQSVALFSSLKPESSAKLGEVDFGHLHRDSMRMDQPQPNSSFLYDPHSILTALKSSEIDPSNSLGDIQSAFSSTSPESFPVHLSDIRKESLPGPPQDLNAPIIKARFVILNWKSPSVNGDNILTYSVYYRQDGSERERAQNTTRSKLEEISIGGLTPGKVYHFKVVAYNSHGPGAPSEELTLTTQAEEHVPSAPIQFEAFATSSRSIHVRWKPPESPKGSIQKYTVYYMEIRSSLEHHIDITELEYDFTNLSTYTEYSIWVVAVNQNGPGAATEEKLVKTFSDVPSEPPFNITLEATGASIVVRWEPPPLEHQNGIITGYKIRLRKKGSKIAKTVTTAASEKNYTFSYLDKESTYEVKLWAMNTNGTSPATEWYEIRTYDNVLDESRVPDKPGPLNVRPAHDKLYLMWTPPKNQNIRVRNYILGWGKGIPDSFSQELDDKTRSYVLERLDPNSEYVISLRASNEVGAGLPVYATVRTQDELPPAPQQPLIPPIGLKVQVLSPTSVLLFWTDTTLGKSQVVTDNRRYQVKYSAEKSGRSRLANTTELNLMISDLKPNTLYEFSVKLVKGRRESPWSMVVTNTTFELPINAAPREVDVHLLDDESQLVELTWQSPKITSGRITGYVILYTDNKTKIDREWKVQAVKGDKHSWVAPDLKPFTEYYFKIQARNSRGYGPFSNVVMFRTGQNVGTVSSVKGPHKESNSVFSGAMLLYIIIAGCILALATISMVVVFLCCRKHNSSGSPDRSKYQKGAQTVKPPDLWIHHDQMELKNMEKNPSGNDGASSSGAMTLPRSIHEYDPHDNPHTNSLDKRSYVAGYAHDPNKRPLKLKPISLPVDSKPPREPIITPINTASLSQSSSDSTPSSRPAYPRTQYRSHLPLHSNPQAVENPYTTEPTSYDSGPPSYISQPPPVAHVPPGNAYAPGMSVLAESQGGKRLQGQGHPLKSFTVPAPPPISAPGTPQLKHIGSQPQVTVRPNSSPFKKAITGSPSSGSNTTPPSRISASNPPPHTAEEIQRLNPSHSTEELNQEMANLEGLMLTLNAITANEFEC